MGAGPTRTPAFGLAANTSGVKYFTPLRFCIGMLIHKANGPPAPTPSMQFELELTQPLQTVAI